MKHHLHMKLTDGVVPAGEIASLDLDDKQVALLKRHLAGGPIDVLSGEELKAAEEKRTSDEKVRAADAAEVAARESKKAPDDVKSDDEKDADKAKATSKSKSKQSK